jgi:hypothetical protein
VIPRTWVPCIHPSCGTTKSKFVERAILKSDELKVPRSEECRTLKSVERSVNESEEYKFTKSDELSTQRQEKVQKDKQRSTKHTYKTKNRG